MENYKIPNNVLKSIETQIQSTPIRLYKYLTFWMGVIAQIYIVIKLFK